MAPATRYQLSLRRRTLRSYSGWITFQVITAHSHKVAKRLHQAKQPDHSMGSHQRNRKTQGNNKRLKRPAPKKPTSKRSVPKLVPNLINNVLPYDIFRIIMLYLDERTLLLQCQVVCKKWADIISGLPLDVTMIGGCNVHSLWFHTIVWALHFDATRMKALECGHFVPPYLPPLACFTYEKASWRQYLRNHILR